MARMPFSDKCHTFNFSVSGGKSKFHDLLFLDFFLVRLLFYTLFYKYPRYIIAENARICLLRKASCRLQIPKGTKVELTQEDTLRKK